MIKIKRNIVFNVFFSGSNIICFACFFTALFISSCNTKPGRASVLLYNGKGSSLNDVAAITTILKENHLDFVTANTAQLNDLDSAALNEYRLIIMPGGNFIEMGNALTVETTGRIRRAVNNGLSYFGICAGGFLAGNTRNNGINITANRSFAFYSAEDSGIRKAPVLITNADGTVIEHYWEDGPQFNGWGEVISKYPDGAAATVQGNYGKGHIVLTGFHPEAPDSWRKEFHFSTTSGQSHQYAWQLIKAALEKTALTHY